MQYYQFLKSKNAVVLRATVRIVTYTAGTRTFNTQSVMETTGISTQNTNVVYAAEKSMYAFTEF